MLKSSKQDRDYCSDISVPPNSSQDRSKRISDFKALLKDRSCDRAVSTLTPAPSSLDGVDAETRKYIADIMGNLREKDKDLILAAEIGQHLLLTNQELTDELQRLKDKQHETMANNSTNKTPKTPRKASGDSGKMTDKWMNSEYLEKLEDENHRLKREMADIQQTPTGTPTVKSSQRQLEALELEISNLRNEMEHRNLKYEELRSKLRRIIREKSSNEKYQHKQPPQTTSENFLSPDESSFEYPEDEFSGFKGNHGRKCQNILIDLKTQRTQHNEQVQTDTRMETIDGLFEQNQQLVSALSKKSEEIENLYLRINVLEQEKQHFLALKRATSFDPPCSNLEDEINDAMERKQQEIATKNNDKNSDYGIFGALGDLLIALVLCPVEIGRGFLVSGKIKQ